MAAVLDPELILLSSRVGAAALSQNLPPEPGSTEILFLVC